MLEAARETLGAEPRVLEEVRFEQMLALPASGARQVQVVLHLEGQGRASVRVSSRLLNLDATRGASSPWILHASGVVRNELEPLATVNDSGASLNEIRARCSNLLTGAGFYAALAEHGLEYGSRFQGVVKIHLRSGEALARLDTSAAPHDDAYVIHPVLLDSCFQILGAALPVGRDVAAPYLPVGLHSLRLVGRLSHARWAHVCLLEPSRPDEVEGDLTLYDADGQPILFAHRLSARRVAIQPRAARSDIDQLL